MLGRWVLGEVPLVQGLALVVMCEIRLRRHQVRGRRQVVGHHVVVGRGTKGVIDHTVGFDLLVSVELRLLLISLRLGVALQ